MSIESFSRFVPAHRWQKILLRPNQKSQTAELEELQDLLQYEQQKALSQIGGTYLISRPIETQITEGASAFQLDILKGQVYISIEDRAYFVDLVPQSFTIPFTGRTLIGISFEFELSNEDLKDPITGGSFSGDKGAERVCLTYTLKVNQDSYPLLRIQSFGPGIRPRVDSFYSDTFVPDRSKVPTRLGDYLSERVVEESGDFIAEGLEVRLQNILLIYPGFGYLKGSLIRLTTPASLSVSQINSGRSYIYLDQFGQVYLTSSVFSNALCLGTLIRYQNQIQIFPSGNRRVNETQLQNLFALQQENETRMQQMALQYEALYQKVEATQSKNLAAIVFNSLSQSDLTALDYSATIVPATSLLRSGLFNRTLDFANLTLLASEGTRLGIQNGQLQYLTTHFTTLSSLAQRKVTGWVSLNFTDRAVPSLTLNPSTTRPTDALNMISSVKPMRLLVKGEEKTISIEQQLKAQEITLQATGFPPNADNLSLKLGSTVISEVTLLEGTSLGSQLGTLKAKADGTLNLKFLIPNNLPLKVYPVVLENEQYSASVYFGADANLVSPGIVSQSGILQPFVLSQARLFSGVNLAFRSAPLLNPGLKAAKVYLVKLQNGIPTQCLSCATLPLSQIQTSAQGSKWTLIEFDSPTPLQPGTYGIAIEGFLSGSELFLAAVDQPALNNQSLNSLDLTPLMIWNKNQWEIQKATFLTFELLQAIPIQREAEAHFLITALEPFHQLNLSLTKQLPCGTGIQIEYRKPNSTWQIYEADLPLIEPSNQLELKIKLTNTPSLSPILDLKSSFLKTAANQPKSLWFSRNFEFDSYQTVSLTYETYNPIGTEVIPYISSNQGQTWNSLARIKRELIDGNIPLYRETYQVTLPKTVVTSNTNNQRQEILRKNLKIKLELNAQDLLLVPFVKNLTVQTY